MVLRFAVLGILAACLMAGEDQETSGQAMPKKDFVNPDLLGSAGLQSGKKEAPKPPNLEIMPSDPQLLEKPNQLTVVTGQQCSIPLRSIRVQPSGPSAGVLRGGDVHDNLVARNPAPTCKDWPGVEGKAPNGSESFDLAIPEQKPDKNTPK